MRKEQGRRQFQPRPIEYLSWSQEVSGHILRGLVTSGRGNIENDRGGWGIPSYEVCKREWIFF